MTVADPGEREPDEREPDPDLPDASRLRALGIDPFADDPADAGAGLPSDHPDHPDHPDRFADTLADRPPSRGPASGSGAVGATSPNASPGAIEPTGAIDRTDPSATADEGREPVADTPMWLAHHWPRDYDRCAVVGGLHVCRRCLVLYPLALVTGVAISIGSWWDHSLDPWVLWLFPLPGVIEFVLDNLRLVVYRPVRQMVLSAGGAVAAGVGYVRYLDDTTDALALSVLAVYVAVCLSAAVVGGLWRQRGRAAGESAP